MTEGIGKITDDRDGNIASKIVNATDSYIIYSEFRNPAERPVDLEHVFYVVNVIDHEGYSQYVSANNYGNHTVLGRATSGYQLSWKPLVPGNYTIITFLVSNWETPVPLSTTTTFSVNVDEKIDTLREGESNNRLKVESINESNDSVTVVYDYCDDMYPYQHSATATLHPGEYVAINSVDAYLSGIRNDKAIFRFDSNGGSDICLV
ncbi:MAG: hypothetical protein HRF40_15120 [Nitrososphaera sp.]